MSVDGAPWLDKLDHLIENCKMSPVTDTTSSTTPRRQARSEITRTNLLEAALREFAAHGFEAASTRAIAAAAQTQQPQINYHFASKEALWKASVDHLFGRLDTLVNEHLSPTDTSTEVDEFTAWVRAFVHAVAELPQLNRIMVQEATIDSERLQWIVDRHSRARFDAVTARWNSLRAAGVVPDIDETAFYYMLIGAASLPFVNAPEARLLGRNTLDDRFVELHADAVVALVTGGGS